MKKQDAKFITAWEASRKGGFVKYIMSHGLAFGLILFLLSGLYHLFDRSFTEVYFSIEALYSLLIWIAGGIIGYGPASWWINEYLYRGKIRGGSDRNP